MMRRFAEAANAQVVVGEIADQLAGFCIAHMDARQNEKNGYGVTLDVAPEFRRSGVAKKRIEEVELKVRSAGCAAMFLHVFTGNEAAIRFYERAGYRVIGGEEGFSGDGADALVYRKALA